MLLWCSRVWPTGAEYRFVDIAQEAGIDFAHRNGAEGLRYLPETYGSGVAFFDCDGDPNNGCEQPMACTCTPGDMQSASQNHQRCPLPSTRKTR